MARHCVSLTGSKFMICIGSVTLAVCLAGLFIFSFVYQKILFKELSLVDGSMATKIWTDIPLPLYEKLYFFNITNADAFLSNKEPLNVTEIGPYTYSAKWIKNDRFWNPNHTVSYREVRTYQFVPEQSVGTQDDVINTLNGPMIIAAEILKEYNIFARVAVSAFLGLEGEKIVTQKSVRQLVYEGYEDPIIKMAPILKPNLPFKNGVFSWLYGKNATDDGIFTVFTGANNASLKNIINNWNGAESVNFWKTEECNKLKGTSVEIGPSLEDNPGTYTFFQSLLCRPLTFNYTGDQTHYDVLMKRFEPTPMIFANSTVNPDNACYEVVKERPSGLIDISPCQFGAPVLITLPHFYMADPIYLKKINGLNPNGDLHNSHLDVEPITGFSAHVGIKFQLNVEMERVPGVFQFNGVPEGVFPIFWMDLTIEITDSWAHFLKGQLNNPKYIAYSLLAFLSLVSLIIIISGIIVLHKYNQDEPLICKDDTYESHTHNEHVQNCNSFNTTVQNNSSAQRSQTN